MKNVLIVGGGVAGMTAAQELAERGYKVTVLEAQPAVPGGKARSQDVTGSATQGRRPLPGEHGFRFFPGFYRHLPDTFKRIPFPNNPDGVFNNLIDTETAIYAVVGHPWFETPVRFPESLHDLRVMSHLPESFAQIGLTLDDVTFFAQKLLQFITSCDERRFAEYERVSWWAFVDAEHRSAAYQTLLATGMTRNLVASQAHTASTRTLGTVLTRLMSSVSVPGGNADRVLNGPTSDAWLDPWFNYLTLQLGVDYRFKARALEILFDPGTSRVTGVRADIDGTTHLLHADHVILATPVEVANQLIPAAMKDYDPVLQGLDRLKDQTAWMSGIQYFLTYPLHLPHAHLNCLGTPWALTAIDEAPFWPWIDLKDFGDGTTQAILSVDISDWESPGTPGGPAGGKAARDCTPAEVAEEVWHQLKTALNTRGTLITTYASWWLDESIRLAPPGSPHTLTNDEPLLVNLINGWSLRPEAWTRIDNFFLAADYVRTNTDLATMEGANEAARRAVNAILEQDRYRGPGGFCEVFTFPESPLFAALRERDRLRFINGLPWAPPADIPWEIGAEVRGEAAEAQGAVTRTLRRFSPRRILSLGREVLDRIFDDGVTVDTRAYDVAARNAGSQAGVPSRPWASYQRWTDLLFCHWAIDPADLRPFVPAELELDTWGGKGYVTLVPMYMAELALPVIEELPGLDHFSELNFRTYVKHKGRRGVYFFRIDAPNALANLGARLFFHTPYETAEQTWSRASDGTVWFASHRVQPGPDATFVAHWKPTGPTSNPAPGSLRAFLADRFSAFAVTGGRVFRGDLIHDPWPVRDATWTIQVNTVLSSFGFNLPGPPDEVYASPGVEAVMWTFEEDP